MKRFVYFLLISFVVLQACTRRPFSVISPSDLQDIMVDLYIAEAIYNTNYGGFKTDEEQEKLINSVLLKHNISRAELDSSMVWYSDNLDELNKINEAVGKSLNRLDTIYRDNAPPKIIYKFTDFTNENLPISFSLDSTIATLAFRMDSTKLYAQGDPEEFNFSFDVLGLDTITNQLESCVYFHYRDTLIVMNIDSMHNDSYNYSHTIDTINRGALSLIRGNIHLTDSAYFNSKVILSKINLKINSKEEE